MTRECPRLGLKWWVWPKEATREFEVWVTIQMVRIRTSGTDGTDPYKSVQVRTTLNSRSSRLDRKKRRSLCKVRVKRWWGRQIKLSLRPCTWFQGSFNDLLQRQDEDLCYQAASKLLCLWMEIPVWRPEVVSSPLPWAEDTQRRSKCEFSCRNVKKEQGWWLNDSLPKMAKVLGSS